MANTETVEAVEFRVGDVVAVKADPPCFHSGLTGVVDELYESRQLFAFEAPGDFTVVVIALDNGHRAGIPAPRVELVYPDGE